LLELLSTMQPTRQALDEILGFFQARLAGWVAGRRGPCRPRRIAGLPRACRVGTDRPPMAAWCPPV